jgi:serine/threonine protein kinase
MNVTIANKYSLCELIGKGQFGFVYSGIYEKRQEPVAIKIESKQTPIKLLKKEATVLQYLYDRGSRISPEIHWFGVWSDYVCVVMPLYDYSLYDRIQRKPPLSTAAINSIMVACISILETIHSNQVLHCDIKPQNFMIKDNELFIIDFGLATFYDETHSYPCKQIVGSSKYASYYTHCGEPLSKRDDLLSIGYMYVYISGLLNIEFDVTEHDESSSQQYSKTDLLHPVNQQWKKLKDWFFENPKSMKSVVSGNIIHDYLQYCYRLTLNSKPAYDALKTLFIGRDEN